jgi:hypothetical protein
MLTFFRWYAHVWAHGGTEWEELAVFWLTMNLCMFLAWAALHAIMALDMRA